jgi:hypothetical protein
MRDRHGVVLAVGDRVRADREAPAKGTWARYEGAVGIVASFNTGAKEIGVMWDERAETSHWAADSWFLERELVKVAEQTPLRRPRAGPTTF